MTFYTNTVDSPQMGQKTFVVKTGAPNANKNDISDGTKTTTVVGLAGQTLTNDVVDIASGLLLEHTVYVYSDALNRSYTVTYLDGTSETVNYACCGLDTETDRDGVTTQHIYDSAKRQVATTRLSITTSNALSAAGQVLSTTRIGADSSSIRLSSATYGDNGILLSQTNALNGVTLYAQGTNASGEMVLTNTYPDGGTRLETYYQDGSLRSVGGTAAHAVQYQYGADSSGSYAVEIKLTDSGGTNEWVKTYSDMLGRPSMTVYAAAATPYPTALFTYNSKGQLTNQIDPDGVTTLYAYNAKGEQVYTVVELSRNFTIDFSGSDEISFTTNDVVTDFGTTVRRAQTYV